VSLGLIVEMGGTSTTLQVAPPLGADGVGK